MGRRPVSLKTREVQMDIPGVPQTAHTGGLGVLMHPSAEPAAVVQLLAPTSEGDGPAGQSCASIPCVYLAVHLEYCGC